MRSRSGQISKSYYDYGGNTIRLTGIDATTLQNSDFGFALMDQLGDEFVFETAQDALYAQEFSTSSLMSSGNSGSDGIPGVEIYDREFMDEPIFKLSEELTLMSESLSTFCLEANPFALGQNPFEANDFGNWDFF